MLGKNGGRCLDEAPKEVDGALRFPSALLVEPPGDSEVVKRQHRAKTSFDGPLNHAAVVGDLCVGELTPRRFDARPFDAEPVVGEAKARQKIHVFTASDGSCRRRLRSCP